MLAVKSNTMRTPHSLFEFWVSERLGSRVSGPPLRRIEAALIDHFHAVHAGNAGGTTDPPDEAPSRLRSSEVGRGRHPTDPVHCSSLPHLHLPLHCNRTVASLEQVVLIPVSLPPRLDILGIVRHRRPSTVFY